MKADLKINVVWKGKEVIIKGKNAMNLGPFRAGKVIQAQAVLLASVDDGPLRASIMTKTNRWTNFTGEGGPIAVKKPPKDLPVDGTEQIEPPTEKQMAYVGTAIYYGPYQEFGTKFMSAQPFLRPAFDLSQGKALTVVYEEGRNQFKEYLK